MKTFLAGFIIAVGAGSFSEALSQCLLTPTDNTQGEVEACQSACGCSSIIMGTDLTIYMDGTWDLSAMGAITFIIEGSGSLLFGGNGKNDAEALILASGSTLIIEDTNNTNALINEGGNGQVRLVIGAAEYDGNDLQDIIENGGANEDGTLPVGLTYFRMASENDQIQLSWSTATEKNNDFFTIEKSKDGMRYEYFATVDGSGNSIAPVDYTYIDPNPHFGRSYYRLSQTDFDGTTVALGIVSVNYSTVKHLSIYPNPVSKGQNLNIQTGADPEEEVDVLIYNHVGVLVRNEPINDNNDINLNELKSGFYLLKIRSGQNIKSTRLVIK